MSNIVINEPEVMGKNRVSINLNIPFGIKQYFRNDELILEYDFDVSDVPKSILAVPAVTLASPVGWATGTDIVAGEVDQKFYHTINDVREGFESLYPGFFDNQATLEATPVENPPRKQSGSALLFSGGVDSTTAFYRRRDESPTLINIVQERDSDKKVARQTDYVEKFASLNDVPSTEIFTNAHSVLDVPILRYDFIEELSRDWWNAIHYGIYYMAVCAPYTYFHGIEHLYQASSYTSNRDLPEAQPFIVESLNWTGTSPKITEDDFKRHEKIDLIADFVSEHDEITISSCYNRTLRENCMDCEKCFRTALGAAAVGVPPDQIDFPVNDDTVENMMEYIREHDFAGFHAYMWAEIQDEVTPGEFAIENEELVQKFLNADIEPDKEGREVNLSTNVKMYKLLPYPVNYVAAKVYLSLNT